MKEDKQFSALKTEAVYSAFGYPGFSRDGINVLEEDNQGRILYVFYGQNFSNHGGIVHILVCQYIDYDEKKVYFYPENNFIIYNIKEEIPANKVEELKQLNDWNEEVDLSKCISRKIGKYKKSPSETEVEEFKNIFKEYNIINDHYFKFCLTDTDKNGLRLYSVRINYENYNCSVFAILFKDDTYSHYEIIEIKDWYYIDVINEFKHQHQWEYR